MRVTFSLSGIFQLALEVEQVPEALDPKHDDRAGRARLEADAPGAALPDAHGSSEGVLVGDLAPSCARVPASTARRARTLKVATENRESTAPSAPPPRRPSSAVSAAYAPGGGRLGLDLLQDLLDAVREAARCPIRDRQFVPDALMVATRGADVVRGRELPQTRRPARDCVGLPLLRVPDARLQKRSAPPPRRPSSAPPATYAHGDDRLGLDAVDGEATRCPYSQSALIRSMGAT